MRQIKHHSRNVSLLLIIGLLSFWLVFIVRFLSSWLVVLRMLKDFLKRKVKPEEIEETRPASTADIGASPVLSPEIEPEKKTADTEVTPEPQTIDTEVKKVTPEPQTIDTEVKEVTPEPQTIDTEIEAESGVSALEATEAYCVKCRQRRAIQGARKVTTKKGRRAVEGTCPVCGTKLFRFIAREKENLSEEE